MHKYDFSRYQVSFQIPWRVAQSVVGAGLLTPCLPPGIMWPWRENQPAMPGACVKLPPPGHPVAPNDHMEALRLKEFYEPMLYLSTPDHPNTMGALVALKQPVDGDILRDVVEELRARFPYFYVKAVARENDLFTVANPLPMTVRNSWKPIALNSGESNLHLAAWKYEGKRLAFEISHSLTDGAGVPLIRRASACPEATFPNRRPGTPLPGWTSKARKRRCIRRRPRRISTAWTRARTRTRG